MNINNRWLIKLLIVCVSIVLSVDKLEAQNLWQERFEQLAADEEDSGHWEMFFEEMDEWMENPININNATKVELEKFPFLTSYQVENILEYIDKHGAMLGEKELMVVKGMDRETIGYLLPFVSFEPVDKKDKPLSVKDIIKYGRHELITRLDVPFYTRKGYYTKYLGYGFYHNLRYNFKYADKVLIGLTAEKDAAEPFFEGRNKQGYDYYSPYILVRDVGRLRTLAIGNYRLSYGHGLVMNTGFSMGKSADITAMSRRAGGITKHSSVDEYNYLRGIATSVKLTNRLTMDAFYSYTRPDATIDGMLITSLKKDGYHRVETDFEKKNAAHNHLFGSSLHYNEKYFELGLTTVYNTFNKVLENADRTYNRYYPKGKEFFNIGLNYKFFWRQFILSGETAFDKGGRIAALHTLSYSPKSDTRFMLLHRFYDVAYQSLYAKSVGEGSMVQNESALYAGFETRLWGAFTLNGYVDYFYFPWKKYQLSMTETTGWDAMTQIGWNVNEDLNMSFRYRFKQKQKDYNPDEGEKQTLPYSQHKLRYQLSYSPVSEWVLKTSANYVNAAYRGQAASQGILLAQSVGYKPASYPFRADFSAAWFHTDDYSSRISMYEKSLLYAFSIPSFYGEGLRFSLQAQYTFRKRLTLEAKYACTWYQDRDVIGSALEQIEGNSKQDLYMQFRWKF